MPIKTITIEIDTDNLRNAASQFDKAVAAVRDALEPSTTALIAQVASPHLPFVQAVRAEYWTPGFNDGEPCEFEFHGVEVLPNGVDPDEDDAWLRVDDIYTEVRDFPTYEAWLADPNHFDSFYVNHATRSSSDRWYTQGDQRKYVSSLTADEKILYEPELRKLYRNHVAHVEETNAVARSVAGLSGSQIESDFDSITDLVELLVGGQNTQFTVWADGRVEQDYAEASY